MVGQRPSASIARFTLGTTLLVVAIVGVLVCVAMQLWRTTVEAVQLAHARGQVDTFWELVDQSEGESPREIAANLRYVLEFYPPGTILTEDSNLSHIVEVSRERAAATLVGLLRESASEDLGEDPAVWVRLLIDKDFVYPVPLWSDNYAE